MTIKKLLPCCLLLLSISSALAGSNPLIWKAQKNEHTIYLLGSIHMGSKEIYPLPKTILNAFDKSQALYVEISEIADKPEAMIEALKSRAKLPEGQTLYKLLPSEIFFSLDKALHTFDTNLLEYNDHEPWYFFLLLTSLSYAQAGYETDLGIDNFFIKKAKSKHIAIEGLETVDEQIEIFDGMQMDQQIQMLETGLKLSSEKKNTPDKMIKAWKEGDADGLLEALEQEANQDNPVMEQLFENLLTVRNKRMANRLDTKTAHQTTSFVVVGALHLLGKGSIIEELEKKDYKTELIK